MCDLTFHLAAAGREVHVVRSQQIYDDPGARRQEDRKARRFFAPVDTYLRDQLRRLVATTKAERLQGRPEHTGKAAWQRQQWPYRAKDVAIGPRTSYARMHAVADRIGKDAEFAEMEREADWHASRKRNNDDDGPARPGMVRLRQG